MRTSLTALLLVLISGALTILLPWIIAPYDNVATDEKMHERVQGLDADVRYSPISVERAAWLRRALNQVEYRAKDPNTTSADLPGILQERERLRDAQRAEELRAWQVPPWRGRTLLIWVVTFLSLGLLVWMSPSKPRKDCGSLLPRPFAVIMFGALLYILPASADWIRNFADATYIRHHFGPTSYDIAPNLWYYEQIEWLLFSVGIAVIWFRALDRRQWVLELPEPTPQAPKPETFLTCDVAKALAKSFDMWAAQSIVLLLCYAPDAFYYYGKVQGEADHRYALQAILDFSVWGATWVVISLPLFEAWGKWRRHRAQLLADSGTADIDNVIMKIDAVQPVGTATLVLAQAAAAATFVFTAFHGITG